MASLAAAKRTKREDIKKGTIFYVKWDMEDGSSKYFKAIATGENKGGKFEIRYTQDGSTEMRKRSTIDDRSKTLISQETYNNTISAYPPKKPSVGEEHQVGELPQVGSDTTEHRALSMVPLTTRDIQIMSATPLTNEEARKDMDRAGKSQEGWGRRRRRKKTRKRKSRKKRKSRRKKRKTKKRKVRKNKKTKKRKMKGRGANICKMFADPNKKKELDAMVLRRAKAGKIHIPVHPDTGEPLTTPLKMLEAHKYCQEMNNWDDNYKCNLNTGNCVEINNEAGKKAINDMLRMRGYK